MTVVAAGSLSSSPCRTCLQHARRPDLLPKRGTSGLPRVLGSAHGQERLLAHQRLETGQGAVSAAHEQATIWFERYAMVGGMPAVVAAEVDGREPQALRDLQKDLVATFRADFARYSGRMDRDILDSVLRAAAHLSAGSSSTPASARA